MSGEGKDQPATPPVPDGWRAIWAADIERWVLEPAAQDGIRLKATVKVSNRKRVTVMAIAAVLLFGWFAVQRPLCNEALTRQSAMEVEMVKSPPQDAGTGLIIEWLYNSRRKQAKESFARVDRDVTTYCKFGWLQFWQWNVWAPSGPEVDPKRATPDTK